MATPGRPRLRSDTRLARHRTYRGLTQDAMARHVGCSLTTYQRLEAGRLPNPRLKWLVNAAVVLDLKVTSLIEPEWLASSKYSRSEGRRLIARI
jgi:DNA-binding XRE family transcriptional regulator